MTYIIGLGILIILYGFGYLLDYLHQEYGMAIAMTLFVIGSLSFITFVIGLVNLCQSP